MTLLSATLSPEQMKDDLYLTWKPLSPFRRVYVMREAALLWAWHVAAVAFFLISIVCAIHYRRRFQDGPAAWKCALAALGILFGSVGLLVGICVTFFADPLGGVIAMTCSLILLAVACRLWNNYDDARRRHDLQQSETPPATSPAPKDVSFHVGMTAVLVPLLLGLFVYLILPKAPDAQVLKAHGWRFSYLFKEDHNWIVEKLNQMQLRGDTAANLVACKNEAASIIVGWSKEKYGEDFNNPFSGLPYREEDSPGNYVIELKDDKPTYFCFDTNGRKIELGAIGAETKKSE